MWWSVVMQLFQPQFLTIALVLLLAFTFLSIKKIDPAYRVRVAGTALGITLLIGNLVGVIAFVPGIGLPESIVPGPTGPETTMAYSTEAVRIANDLTEQGVPQQKALKRGQEIASWTVNPGMALVWYPLIGTYIGLAVFLIRLGRSNKLATNSRPAEPWMESVLYEFRQPSDKKPIQLKISDTVLIPSAPYLSATILLPDSATDWDLSKLRAVIAHEVAHIQERHTIWVGMAEVSAFFTWFVPWGWLVVRKMKTLSEYAADDAALRMGVRSTDLSEALLSFSGQKTRSAAVLQISDGGDIKSRIQRMLRTQNSKSINPKYATWTGAALSIVCTIFVASNVAAFARTGSIFDEFRDQRITDLDTKNKFRGVDSEGKKVEVAGMTMKRGGNLMDWTVETGWTKNPDQSRNIMSSFYDRGGTTVLVKLEGWPSNGYDRAYSLTNPWAITFDQGVSVRLESGNTGSTTLVYSRQPWKEVGRTGIGQKPTGRFAEFNGIRYGLAKESKTDQEFFIDYGQIVSPLGAPFELSYEWKPIDRSRTDRRVICLMKNGEKVVTRQFILNGANPMREAWRAYVKAVDIKAFVIEERPTLFLKINNLPIGQERGGK
ncbi:MAG: M56 family metallopeptidase [Fimbriimonadaceae bacterium]|nr:MAG: M56 family metallopeptidase [Fimbriimonadaceae bacterium]